MTDLSVGVCLLPERRWAQDAQRWQQAEAMGFATLWTYDHLSWRSLRNRPWYAAMPLLTAAAGVTDTARLGVLVATPNVRHPVPFAKEVMTLDDVSGGRFDLGLGSGGTGADATVLGGEALPPGRRMTRFEDFVELLDRLLTAPVTTYRGSCYTAVDARMVPGPVQRPRVPFTIAATGPRGLRLAAAHAQTWVTFGPASGATDRPGWWADVHRQQAAVTAACERAGRDPAGLRRMVLVSLDLTWAQASPAAWDDFTGRLTRSGFTDVVVHWPRPADPALAGPAADVFDHIVGGLGGG